jgi:hypothetical protein
MCSMRKVVLGSLLLLVLACGSEPEEENPLLARVHNRELRLSELEGMFPPDATAEDSTLIIEGFVNRWVRDAVLLHEAERNLPSDLNVDRMVRDYRASLVRTNYEKVLVAELLDSTITEDELSAFYEQYKESFQLETPIVRCYFIKLPANIPNRDTIQELWNNGRPDDMPGLRRYCDRLAEVALLQDSAWYSVEELARQLPEGTITASNVGSKREFTQSDGQWRYYFRLFESKNRKEIAPLAYIENQARKVILHQRKLKVLEDAREQIFEQELRRKNVETFTN